MKISLKELIILIFRRTCIHIFSQHKHASSYTNNPMEYNETKTYHNIVMVAKCNLIENAWLSTYGHIKKVAVLTYLHCPKHIPLNKRCGHASE